MNPRVLIVPGTVCLLLLGSCGVDAPADLQSFMDLAAMGNVEQVRAGLAAHPEWSKATSAGSGRTALHGAAQMGRLAVVRLLCEAGADPVAKDPDDGSTPLHSAAENGRDEVVTYLLGRGVAVDVRDGHGKTPLHECAWASDAQRDVVKTLLKAGAAIDATDEGGFTPLLLAAIRGNADTVELLIERGAKLDAEAEDGRTALSAARDGDHTAVVEALEKAGAAR